MSPDPGQLLILGACSASLVANAVTAYFIWRGRDPIEVIHAGALPFAKPHPLSGHDAASRGGAAMGGAPSPEFKPQAGLRSNGHGGARFHAQWEGKSVEVVATEDGALRLEFSPVKGDLINRDGEVAQVRDFHTAAFGAVGNQQPLEPNTDAHGIAANHPVGVEDAERGTDNGDPEGDPADPVHSAEHSAPLGRQRKSDPPFRSIPNEPPHRNPPPLTYGVEDRL